MAFVMILSLGATHRKASVPMLESITFENKHEAMRGISSLDFVSECTVLQTCNRIEIYVVTTSEVPVENAVDTLVSFWSQKVGVSKDLIERVTETYYGEEALLHLLLLASGLESMVVGEDQILGQVRLAYVESKKIGAAKDVLERVFMKAVNVGRKVRANTAINKGGVSISSVAVDFADAYLGGLANVKALVVGAGEAGSLVAEDLSKRGIRSILIANRTYSKGLRLAKSVGGRAVKYETIYGHLSNVDLVVVASSSKEPIFTEEKTRKTLEKQGKASDLLFVDISQPRCVEESVSRLPKVNLKNIDDLREIVEDNLKKRLDEAEKAKIIVFEELEQLGILLRRMLAKPVVSSLCRKVEKIRKKELSKAFRMLINVNREQHETIENLTRELADRILQLPIENLRTAALNNDRWLISAAEKLFGLGKGKNEQKKV